MKDFAAIDFETANSERSSVCSAFQMYQMDYPDYQFFCTCRASRNKLGSRLPNHQLQMVATYCGYDLTQHHNALADAEACAWNYYDTTPSKFSSSTHSQYPLQRTGVFYDKYWSIPYYVLQYSILSTGDIQHLLLMRAMIK